MQTYQYLTYDPVTTDNLLKCFTGGGLPQIIQ